MFEVKRINASTLPRSHAPPHRAGCSMNPLIAELLEMPDAERRAALAALSPDELTEMNWCWELWARPDQLPPPGAWRTWLLLGGRGAGKSRSAAEWIRSEVESGRRRSLGIAGPTADSVRRDQVSAILACSPPWNMPVHEPSTRRILWQNGAIAYLLTSAEPDRVRGINLDGAWCDELTSWDNQADTWSNLQLALRVPGPLGDAPRAIVSTTPKRQALLKEIIAAPSTSITRSTTYDNAANLSPETIEFLRAKYENTTLGRQEMLAELIDDLPGAMWSRSLIDRSRVTNAPDTLLRVVVAIDPSGSPGRDETGIVVAAVGVDGRGYVLADLSGQYSPQGWAQRAVDAYRTFNADRIIAEVNYGGGMVEATIRAADSSVPVKMVTSSRGKVLRAEPIVAFYEQNRVSHVGHFNQLEDQMAGWDPAEAGPSPDRIDALVFALTDLMSVPRAKPSRWVEMNWMHR